MEAIGLFRKFFGAFAVSAGSCCFLFYHTWGVSVKSVSGVIPESLPAAGSQTPGLPPI
jgi:hypothetical protein